ncbi:MAG: hypothetical protein A2539_10380 [Elusimicrobia bacterium RIFOXYD2_FULL_34_15]|nr:MAG: hypothetical protein A2539_10380 [Elusimicrobia bacterium RIFOXYD2_FULL_34_15]
MSKLSKNIVYNIGGQGLLLILSLVAVKYVFNRLGGEALGIIYFTFTLNAIICAVMEMGISSTVVREVSAHVKDEPDYIHKLIQTVSLFHWAIYILFAVIIYFGAPFIIEKWINLKSMDTATAKRVLQILGIAALTALPKSLYASIFRGLQRMEFNNIIDVFITGLQQFGIIVILAIGGGLMAVVSWMAISFLLGMICYLFSAFYFFSWKSFIPAYHDSVIKKNLGYTSNMMLISVLSMIHMQFDKVIASKFLSIAVFGYYNFAYGAVSKATLMTSAIAQAAFPSFSALFKEGGRDCMMPQYRKLQDMLCFSTVPIFAAVPFAAIPIFRLVFNNEVAKSLLLPITFLAIGFYMHGTLNVPYFFSLSVGKPEISVKSNFYALFIVLPVTALLIYFFGLNGAGFSWIFYQLFAYSYAIPRICSECLIIPVSEWYGHILRIFILISLSYGLAWLVLYLNNNYSIFALILAYISASIVFLIGSYFLISEDFKKVIFSRLNILKVKFVPQQ